MTPNEAKKVIKNYLDTNSLPYTRLSAKIVGFSDLARNSAVFVTVHGWQPRKEWADVKALAWQNDFSVEAG